MRNQSLDNTRQFMLTHLRFDLVPARVFANRMPLAFLDSWIHWYDHESAEVTFRPRDVPWKMSSDDHWHLRRHGSTWRLHKGSQTLLDIKSGNAQMISSLFKALEDKPHMHVFYDAISESIEIELPRLKLDFFIARGDENVQSRQYRGMLLDNDQRIGTLVGLTSKLVLRRATHVEERLVLIPEGTVTYRGTLTHHVSVSIGRQKNTTVHAYQLDQTLGRILDSGAMQSKLALCFLHALTSHLLPDPLTGHTGTESALTILSSSAVRSFEALTFENVALLNKIANLSPKREFYPSHEHVMQKIDWNPNIPFQSQHGDFQILVKEIFLQEKKMSLFHSKDIFAGLDGNDTAWMSAISTDLHERAASRISTFQVAGFGAQHFQVLADKPYNARDRRTDSERARRAFLAASLLERDEALLDQPITNFNILRTHFKNADVRGFVDAQKLTALHYDSKWLGSPSPLMRELWCTLHHCLTTKSSIGSKFDVLIWLATMAFANDADVDVIQALAAFYRVPQLVSTKIPAKPVYHLTQGSAFKETEVQNAAQSTAQSYDDSTEARLPKEGSETDDEHLQRIERLFETRKGAAVQNFITSLRAQWPSEAPSTPASDSMEKYLNMSSAMEKTKDYFQVWYDNQEFERYISTISKTLKSLSATAIAPPRFNVKASPQKMLPTLRNRFCDPAAVFASSPPAITSDASSVSDPPFLVAPQKPKLNIAPESALADLTETGHGLNDFCQTLSVCAKSPCEQSYVDALRTSCDLLHKHKAEKDVESFVVDEHARNSLRKYLSDCKDYFECFDGKLRGVLENGPSKSDAIASSIQLSPRQSPSFWLGQLNHARYDTLPLSWSKVIVEYGLAITNLHRAQRLVALLDKPVELNEELQHVGHTNWNPREFPETLLLEAESGIMVRQVQAMIATEMMEPKDGQNTVMQLNMGEGKSSTIVPIVAAALADKQK